MDSKGLLKLKVALKFLTEKPASITLLISVLMLTEVFSLNSTEAKLVFKSTATLLMKSNF